ncbi:MAG: hypothetical protein ABI759_22000 [Candidatus Solibacter sp.]
MLFQWLGDWVRWLLVSVPLLFPAVIMMRPEPSVDAAFPVFWVFTLTSVCGSGAVALFRLNRMRQGGKLEGPHQYYWGNSGKDG